MCDCNQVSRSLSLFVLQKIFYTPNVTTFSKLEKCRNRNVKASSSLLSKVNPSNFPFHVRAILSVLNYKNCFSWIKDTIFK